MDEWEINQRINKLEQQALSQESVDRLLYMFEDLQYDFGDLQDNVRLIEQRVEQLEEQDNRKS